MGDGGVCRVSYHRGISSSSWHMLASQSPFAKAQLWQAAGCQVLQWQPGARQGNTMNRQCYSSRCYAVSMQTADGRMFCWIACHALVSYG